MNCPNWGNWTFFASHVPEFCCLTREKDKKLKKMQKARSFLKKPIIVYVRPEFIRGF